MVSNDGARVLPWLLALLLVVPGPGGAFAEEEGAPEPEAAEGATALAFEGEAPMEKFSSLGQEDFRFTLKIKNPGERPITIHKADLLLAHLGGWLVPLDPDSLDGTFFRGALEVPAGEEVAGAANPYRSITPATHAVLCVQADDGRAQSVFPILREEFEAPKDYRPPAPYGIGLVGPLQVVRFSDGKDSILVLGQHQLLCGNAPAEVETSLQIANDSGSSEPVTWKGLDVQGDLNVLWPFVRRLPVFDGFESGFLRVTSSALINGKSERFAGTWPVVRRKPIEVRAPLLGTWQLSNGPGRSSVESRDVKPQDLYAYDMVVLTKGRTHKGDPHLNESYYAWGRTVRAVADGEVVDVCDHERDNPGYRGAFAQCYNNRVVLKHPGDVYSAYLHIMQHSRPKGLIVGTKVKAGQKIARVGNSGESSEPHLHFLMFRIDATGRIRPVPVHFTRAFHDAAGTQPVEGVPLSGKTYHFRNR